MANVVPSTNMSLPIPIVGQDPGPTWATDINSCFTLLDAHDHSSGSGVQITAAGININTDFPMNNSNITTIKSARFYSQSAALGGVSDLGCLYEVVNDLYYNDGSGNQIRITQSGAVAGTPGSISNLTSPASAAYVSANSTFVFQSDVNKPGNIDGGYFILRNNSTSSKGLSLYPPAAMGADFNLTLPSLPASQKFMTLDASGNISAPWAVDNSTLEISSNTLQVKDLGITRPKLAALGQQLSSSCSTFVTTSATLVDVTNLTVTITTTGRPVCLAVVSDGTGTASEIGPAASGATASLTQDVVILRASTEISRHRISFQGDANSIDWLSFIPSSSINHIDIVAAGTYTYKVQTRVNTANTTGTFKQAKFLAYEIG